MEAATVMPPRTARASVVIYDAQLLLGEALRSLLEADGAFDVVAVVTGEDVLAAEIARQAPDLVLASLSAETDSAAGVLAACERRPGTRVVVLVDELDGDAVNLCFSGGVHALLEKADGAECILSALEQVLSDHMVLPAGWRTALPHARAPATPAGLSERQADVLRLMVDGLSNRQIADQLFISVNTVKFHLRVIFRELGVRNRVDAVRRYGWVANTD